MELKLEGAKDLFDTDKVENGVWVDYLGTIINEEDETESEGPQFLDGDPNKPMQLLVRSIRCTAVQKLERRHQREAFVGIQKATKAKKEDAAADMLVDNSVRFPVLLLAFKNFSADASAIQNVDAATAKSIFDDPRYSGIVQQVLNAANDDEKYRVGKATPARPPVKTGEKAAPATTSDD